MSTIVEQVRLSEVDLDSTIPCQSVRDNWNECSRPAEWVSTLQCCHEQKLICSYHVEDFNTWYADRVAQSLPIVCANCFDFPMPLPERRPLLL